MKLKTIKNIKKLSEKRVLVRVDFNVAVKNNKVINDTKIKAALPTIKYLIEKNARIILISHLGRPSSDVGKFSLNPIVKNLEKLLGQKVKFIDDCVGEKVKNKIEKMKGSEIILLENLRFYKEEIKNSKKFAKNLASFADVYINDAFAVSHRVHSSIAAITSYLPSYAGFLIEKEIKNLSVLFNPKKPYIVLLGGAKLKTKISLISALSKRADKILIGGVIANQFLKMQGYDVGKSLIKKEVIKKIKRFKFNDKIFLPKDVIVAKKISADARAEAKNIDRISKDDIILDIGPETIREYAKILKSAKMILWNGPMGMLELRRFANGSTMLARIIACAPKAFTVCGGGETIIALEQTKMKRFVNCVSTGGGAMLSYLASEKMPGIKPLLL